MSPSWSVDRHRMRRNVVLGRCWADENAGIHGRGDHLRYPFGFPEGLIPGAGMPAVAYSRVMARNQIFLMYDVVFVTSFLGGWCTCASRDSRLGVYKSVLLRCSPVGAGGECVATPVPWWAMRGDHMIRRQFPTFDPVREPASPATSRSGAGGPTATRGIMPISPRHAPC